jgi:hypothetical protein
MKSMSEPEPLELREPIPVIPRAAAPRPRPVGAPLSAGTSSHASQSSAQGNINRLTSSPPPARALPSDTSVDDSSGMQRAVNAFRMVVPIVQRLLPLLDGNFATAVANLISPRSHPQPAPEPKLSLAPLEEGIAELKTQHHGLREQVIEQSTALKRVSDKLEMVREATDRNTLEQQELLEELKAFSHKVKIGAVVGIGLLTVGFLLELMMFFHLQRVLP